jgi:bifunctional non-homologous end joining protein LigD
VPRPDLLEKYNAKRDFAKTAEPAGVAGKGAGDMFMVQKHDATRLHWDLRLEAGGVLKSWAVTRGPSLNPDDKRLAVRTEDHPLSYATFEGTIPAKAYGGGTVMLWDRGTWAPIAGKSAKDIDGGHLHFTLDGERMKGEWMLIRLKPRGRERGENWLLRKVNDAFVGGSDDLVERAVTSVATGRTMAEIAAGKPPPRAPKRTGKAAMPKFHAPQLATLVDTVPAGSDWIHEVKYDGYRAQIAIAGGKAKVFTRSGLDWSAKFPEIVEAAAALDVDSALIDGEICALDGEGRPDFSALRIAIKDVGSTGLTLFAFDLLILNGKDLTKQPNVERKAMLAAIISDNGAMRYAEHIVGAGEKLFEAMCGAGYEGIVSKRADAPYSGKRTQAWLKVKCTRRQEFVIVGWSASDARTRGFKSLLLALNEDGPLTGSGLRYAGKVGTGFDADLLADLRARMDKIATDKPAVDVPRVAVRGAHWVKPQLVAEIAFAEFTADNVVRHASFIGLREGNSPRDVVKEDVGPAEGGTAPAERSKVEDTGIKITNPERIIFPGDGITKGQLAAYYIKVGPVMLPWIADRPVSFVRCPQGRAKQCFFQKHDAGSFGDAVHKVPIREKDGGTEDYLWLDSIDGLVAAVQMGSIEFHGWGSRASDVERPDRLVIDLDPDEELDFDAVKKAAIDIRGHLADLGLVSFALLSGGKGVHIVVPLTPDAEWPAVKDFASRFAQALAAAETDRFVATMSKAKRKGRIFIDWLRNQRGSTAVLPYVVRARPGAPVAAPVTWEELRDTDSAARFHLGDVDELIDRAGSKNLKGWGIATQVLPGF